MIKWYAPWRQYCFNPEPRTTFNHECLKEIAQFCRERTQAHRAKTELCTA